MLAKLTALKGHGARTLTSLGLLLWLGIAPALAGPAIEDIDTTGIAVTAGPDQIRWGDSVSVEVSATNSTGSETEGGLLVSFDHDVLVLDAQGARILRPGDSIFNMKSGSSAEITRPMVELWAKDWKPGVEKRLQLLILPLESAQLRVRARATFLQRSSQPRLFISPGRMQSRSFDEGGFPTKVAYVQISSRTNFRRAIRRLERRIRALDEDGQRQFAAAISDMLDDPKSLAALSEPGTDGDPMGLLAQNAPLITKRLRSDPIVALEKLRCIMARLNCTNGLVYFGMPISMLQEFNSEELLEQEAKKLVAAEKGADNLIALLDAEGLTLTKSKDSGAVYVSLNNERISAGPGTPIVLPLLEKIVAALGKDASREHKGITPASFTALLEMLGGPKPTAGTASDTKKK